MVDPQHPQYERIYVSRYVDHLAIPVHLNSEPLCKQSSLWGWANYADHQTDPASGVRLCSRCAAIAERDA